MSGQTSASIDQTPGFDGEGLTEDDLQNLRESGPERDPEIDDDGHSTLLSLDKQFELLKNQRRRWVLSFLMENGGTSTTGELAEHVAVRENEKDSVNEITSKERKAAYVGLYQCHLPKMDDYGVIEFNQARGKIELEERANELKQYLENEALDQWVIRYLGIAVGGGALFILAMIADVAALATGTAGATILGVIFIAAWQLWQSQQD